MWTIKSFQELSTTELYTYLQLRVNVFVVEQSCPYQEIDGYDIDSYHLAYIDNGELLSYARILPAGIKYDRISIGRVIVNKNARGRGLAKQLMEQAISFSRDKWPMDEVQLQAQTYLRSFYGSFGFEEISEEYDEDGIPHVDMMLKKL
ncbi:GNAT family N-acetyltransferase [Paenisporosarcina sp. NPDC076898]|uniref:GNAT family N-acetyltransferase n=1 Tax=unclassified Paenisporosarcina TaxID=2642018 RepID=UPI003CFFFA9F